MTVSKELDSKVIFVASIVIPTDSISVSMASPCEKHTLDGIRKVLGALLHLPNDSFAVINVDLVQEAICPHALRESRVSTPQMKGVITRRHKGANVRLHILPLLEPLKRDSFLASARSAHDPMLSRFIQSTHTLRIDYSSTPKWRNPRSWADRSVLPPSDTRK